MSRLRIYLDNAATSWPKAPGVAVAMAQFLEEVGASPGRSAHRSAIDAGRLVDDLREALAWLFGLADPLRVCLGSGATFALNQAICGLLRAGDHVVTSAMEHNSVMRPLRALERQGIDLTVVPCAGDGSLAADDVAAALRPTTRLVVLNHASNVTGTIQPIAEVGGLVRRHGALLLVDAAATAGSLPIDVVADGIDLLAVPGHKALCGPPGIGALLVGARVEAAQITPLVRGGTGSLSEREQQPQVLPDALESGTPNTVGCAGLLAAVRWLDERRDEVRQRRMAGVQRLLAGLGAIPGVTVHGPADLERRAGAVSFEVQGLSPSEVGLRLDDEHGVQCRVGLHCAPAAHRTIGTFPTGTVRFAPGPFSTPTELDAAIDGVAALARDAQR